MEKFIKEIANHLSNKFDLSKKEMIEIIKEWETYKDEFLQKHYSVNIDGKDFGLEKKVFDLFITISKERDYYKGLNLLNEE